MDEESIRKKKDKKLKKSFDITINGKKVKIVNFIFKLKKNLDREGRVIRLISKHDIYSKESKNITIKINRDNKVIIIVGEWCSFSMNVGCQIAEYWVNEYIEE